eukprot:90850_1
MTETLVSDTEMNSNDDEFIISTNSTPIQPISSTTTSHLSISEPQSMVYLGNINNSDPKFIRAFKTFTNLRLLLRVLRNNTVMPEMIEVVNTANKIINGVEKPIELGSISAGTLGRLQQFRGHDLIVIESAYILWNLWDKDRSVMSIYHDGTNQKCSHQESILFAFNIEPFEELEIHTDSTFTPPTTEGIIFRGVFHQNVPKTDAVSIIKWAVSPAFQSVDNIGFGLYGSNWISMEERMKEEIGLMTDGNNGAQKTSAL